MKPSRKLALIMAVAAASSLTAQRKIFAVALSATGTYSQNFDSMVTSVNGAVSVPLPTDWKWAAGTAPSFFTANTTTTQAATSSATAGGAYDWGSSTTERAVGFLTSGSFASPNSMMVKLDNTTGSTVTEFDFSYDIERYKINTAAAQVNLFISTDGTNWTADTAGDTGAFSTGSSVYTFTSSSNQTVVHESVSVAGLSIASGSSYYIRWNFNTTGANSQGLGLDNFNLTSVLAPSSSGPANLTWSPASPSATTWNGTGTNKNWTNTVPAAANFNTGDSVNFTDSGLANGSNVTIDVGGVSAGTVAFSNTGGTYTLSGGTLTASGVLSISGGGTVVLNNTISSSSTLVTSGTLAGTATFTTPVMIGGTTNLAPGNIGIAGTMTMPALALQGTTISMDIGNAFTTDSIIDTGPLTLSGANLIALNAMNSLTVGTYSLIHYNGSAPGTNPTQFTNLGLLTAHVGGKYAFLSNNLANNSIDIIIQDAAAPVTFTYSGGNSGTSSTFLTAANWSAPTAPGTVDIAVFSTAAPSATTIGFNFNSGPATNNGYRNQALGAIRLTDAPSRTLNNNAGADGTLTINGVNGELLTNSSTSSSLTIANGSTNALNITLGSVGTVEVTNAAASIAISSNIAGPGGINKTGAGLLTLSGTNFYSGTTTVSQGTLLVNSAASGLGTGITVVNSGAILGGTGVASSPVSITNTGIINPGPASAVGTLTLGDLTLNSANLNFDVSTASVDQLVTAGLTLNGNSVLKLKQLGGSIPLNTFTLLKYTGTPLADLSAFSFDTSTLPPIYSYTFVNNTANLSVDLVIAAFAGNQLVWDATVNGVWDVAGPANWKGGATSYSDNKILTFDDTAAGPGAGAISLTSTVAPFSMAFNNATLNYTITNVGGTISGPASLLKTAAGILTLSGANAYTGGNTITGGVLQFDSSSALGTAGGITISAATLADIAGSGIQDLAQSLTVGTAGATFNVAAGATANVTSVNGSTSNNSFTKTGPGTLSIANSVGNSNPLFTSINAGVIALSGFSAGSTFLVPSTPGHFVGNVSIAAGGRLNFVGPLVSTNTTFLVSGGGKIIATGDGVTLAVTGTGGTSVEIDNEIDLAGAGTTLNIGSASTGFLGLNANITGSGNINFETGGGNFTGTILIEKAQSFAGDVTINNSNTGGVLRIAVPNAIPATSGVTFGNLANSNNVGYLDLAGENQAVAFLATNLASGKIAGGITNTSATTGYFTVNGSTDTTFTGSIGAVASNAATFLPTSNNNIGLIKSGPGTLTLAPVGTTYHLTYNGGTTINGGTLLVTASAPTFLPTAAAGPSVILNPGGTLALSAAATPHAAAFSVASTFFSLSGGKLSLANNDLVISGSTTAAAANLLAGNLNHALVPATSNGNSLLTTGVMTGADFLALRGPSATFDALPTINSTDILLRFGYAGDANFDGVINIDDYLLIDAGYRAGATDYTHGNFDHSSGPVNAADYALIDASYLNLSGPLASGEIALHAAEFGAPYTDALNSLLSTTIPEPTSLALLALGASSLFRRNKGAGKEFRNRY